MSVARSKRLLRGGSRLVPIGLLLAMASGCGSVVAKRLQTAAETSDVPSGLVVVYDDHDPTWGGKRIEVDADGSIEVRRWRPGQPVDDPLVSRGQLSQGRMVRLVKLLVQIEAWEQRVEPRSPRLDDRKATLVIRIDGHRKRMWEWANDLQVNRRLVRIERYLQDLARQARAAG